jgi:hypothetical protein
MFSSSRWRGMRRAAVVAALGLGLLPTASAVSRASEPSDASPMSDPAFIEASQHAREAEERRRSERGRPEAQQRRRKSRTAYQGMAREESLKLAQRAFPEVMRAAPQNPMALRPGQRLREYLNDFTARVDNPNDEHAAILHSLTPLRTAARGHKRAVDLALVQRGDSLEPANSAVPLALPRRSTQAMHLGAINVGIELLGARDTESIVTDDKVFLHSVDTDLDAVLVPAPAGVEILWSVRSAAAPEVMGLNFELPPGARLDLVRRAVDGSLSGNWGWTRELVEIRRNHALLASIQMPLTLDADGEMVPSHYEVAGNALLSMLTIADTTFTTPH